MAIDRAALTTYLAAWYGELADEAGLALTDTSTGFGPVLDATAASLAANAELDEATWAQPLAEYYLLRRIVRALATNMDVSVGGDSYRLKQIRDHAQALYDEAAAAVGGIVGSSSDGLGQVVTVHMPYLTPAREEVETW